VIEIPALMDNATWEAEALEHESDKLAPLRHDVRGDEPLGLAGQAGRHLATPAVRQKSAEPAKLPEG
jgi:hypothetical protein